MQVVPKDFTLHALLTNPNEQFVVPSYQRRYAWRAPQQTALFKDIDMLLPGDGHLFGMLILHTEYYHGGLNKVGVVDGQQRLTSITILLYALYKKFSELGDNYTASQIKQMLYSGNPEIEKIPKLVLGELDNPDYVNLLNDKFDKINNKNILGAYTVFSGFINQSLEGENEGWLTAYFQKLVHTAKIIRLDVQQAQDAYKLFETINNRGLKLSATDILKNFVLGHAAKISNDKLEEAKELWSDLIIALDGIPTDDFFRQYVSSVYKRKISMSKLIEEFKKHYFKNVLEVDKLGEYRYNYGLDNIEESQSDEDDIEDDNDLDSLENEIAEDETNSIRQDIADYLAEIVKAAQCYSKIWNRSFGNEKLNQKMADLQAIRSFPSYIFLMHYLQYDLEKKKVYEVLDMIATVMLRRHMTGTSTAYNDDIFAKLMRLDIEENDVTEIRNVLLEYYIGDDEFIDKFPLHELKQRVLNRARYILTKIEYFISGDTNELSINSTEDVHVEHIIPQKITTKNSKKEFGDWESYLPGNAKLEHKKRVNRIGNMTLFSGRLNIKISNGPFLDKRQEYRNSNINLTKSLSEERYFKFDHLDKRGKELAEIAVKIWRL